MFKESIISKKNFLFKYLEDNNRIDLVIEIKKEIGEIHLKNNSYSLGLNKERIFIKDCFEKLGLKYD
jgi:hypothetical protein